VEEHLTVRQKRLLGEALKVTSKRKATKSPSESRQKKTAKVTTGKRKSRKQKMLFLDATEEEKSKAEEEALVREVVEYDAKEKAKEKELENS
jgi:hypothetical protein